MILGLFAKNLHQLGRHRTAGAELLKHRFKKV
jgi:hypothetical protein